MLLKTTASLFPTPMSLCKVVGINGCNAGGKGIGHCSGPFLSTVILVALEFPPPSLLPDSPQRGYGLVWYLAIPQEASMRWWDFQ